MARYELFESASKATRDELTRRGQPRTFHAGQTLFHLGDRATELFLLESGRVKLWRAFEAGTALTLAYIYPGELIGMVATALDGPHSVTATATVDARSMMWSAAFIRDLLGRDPALAAGVAAVLAGRTELLVDRMEDVSLASVDQRVARALVRLSAEIGQDGEGGPIRIAITQSEIAELAQTTVPTVSRLMSRWRDAGILETSRGEIVVHKLDRLCVLSGLDG